MTANNDDDIFDDSFDDMDVGGDLPAPERGSAHSSLLDLWNNNPMVKLAVIAGLFVIAVGSVYAFVGSRHDKDTPDSTVSVAPNQKEAPGGAVSENYGNALEEQNQQKLEQALGNRNVSAIPVPVNRSQDGLAIQGDQDVSTEDPLAVWQKENATPAREKPVEQPVAPPVPPPAAPQVAPEQVQALSQAINNQIQNILQNRAVKPARYQAFIGGDAKQVDIEGGKPVGTLNHPGEGVPEGTESASNQRKEEILVPAGTILYAQILNEANSDTPGPILAEILSGPLVGSRAIGSFDQREEKIVITFNTMVVDGVGNSMNGVAIDPNSTSPGLATDVNHRYFRRVVLPAAARFVEGLGDAFATQESTVFTSGDVIVSQQNKLSTKKEFARGVSEGAQKAGEILDQEGDRLRPLIRVQAGTPIGIVLVDPVLKP